MVYTYGRSSHLGFPECQIAEPADEDDGPALAVKRIFFFFFFFFCQGGRLSRADEATCKPVDATAERCCE